MTIHGLWIPTQEGERQCCCCGIHFGGVTLPCGDHYCQICEGRGHDDPHDDADCQHGVASSVFRRMEHDCAACGLRHMDWETCATLLHEYAKTHDPLAHYRVVSGVVVEVRDAETE